MNSKEQFEVSTRMLLAFATIYRHFIRLPSQYFLSRLPEILAKSQSLCSSTVFLDISHSLYYILVARISKCILGRPANEKNWLISEKAVDSIPRLDKISHVIIFRNLRDLLGLKANNIDRPRN